MLSFLGHILVAISTKSGQVIFAEHGFARSAVRVVATEAVPLLEGLVDDFANAPATAYVAEGAEGLFLFLQFECVLLRFDIGMAHVAGADGRRAMLEFESLLRGVAAAGRAILSAGDGAIEGDGL